MFLTQGKFLFGTLCVFEHCSFISTNGSFILSEFRHPQSFTGAYTAILNNKVDCIIFTGGIGENSPLLHNLVCEGLHPVTHDNYSRDNQVSDISAAGSSTRVLVVKTNEELAIARECVKLMR